MTKTMQVDWDGGHCYCQCELCYGENDTIDCEQELYCVPELINELAGTSKVVSCECADKADVDHVEGFIYQAEAMGSGEWYHTHLLRKWVALQKIQNIVKS